MPSEVVRSSREKPANAADQPGKYLIFQLDSEEFGVPVWQAREILGVQSMAAMPQVPIHIKGVINCEILNSHELLGLARALIAKENV